MRHKYLTIHFSQTTVKGVTQLIIKVFIYISISNCFGYLHVDDLGLWLKVRPLVLNMFLEALASVH